MNEYVKTTALPTRIEIDTNRQATNRVEGKDKHPLWLAASAAIIVNSDQGPCVLLVQRKGATLHSGKWALIPAGASECLAELRDPRLALVRELKEELKLTHNGKKICDPREYLIPLPLNDVVIFDRAYGGATDCKLKGEIIPAQGKFMFMQAFLLDIPLEELKIKDGEKDELDKELDRVVAAVKVYDDRHGRVMPVAKFRNGKRSCETQAIDLSGYQTPTLDWFRQYRHRIRDKLDEM